MQYWCVRLRWEFGLRFRTHSNSSGPDISGCGRIRKYVMTLAQLGQTARDYGDGEARTGADVATTGHEGACARQDPSLRQATTESEDGFLTRGRIRASRHIILKERKSRKEGRAGAQRQPNVLDSVVRISKLP